MMKYCSWGLQVAVSNAGEAEHVGWLPCPSLHINKSHFEYCWRALVPLLLRCWNGSMGKNGNCSVLPSLISQHQISISIFQHLNEIICLGNEGVGGWLRPDDPPPLLPSLLPSLHHLARWAPQAFCPSWPGRAVDLARSVSVAVCWSAVCLCEPHTHYQHSKSLVFIMRRIRHMATSAKTDVSEVFTSLIRSSGGIPACLV